MKWTITINFLFLSALLFAQDPYEEPLKPIHLPETNYFSIYAEPSAMLDLDNGASYRFGAQYNFSPEWALYGGYGGYIEQGYMTRIGIKRYISGRDNERYAIGIEYFNNWHVSTWHDVFRHIDSATGIPRPTGQSVSIYTRKHINTITVVFSRELFIGRHWVLELYGGAGIKFRDVWKSLPDSIVDKMYHYHEGMIEAPSISETPRVTLDISAGLRFHRVFRRCPFVWKRN